VGRECEYAEARRFLDKINCEHFVAVIGNHDKRNMVGHELFKEYVYNPQVIFPSSHQQTQKQKLFLDRKITKLKENFTDVNFLEILTIGGKRVLFIGIDNTLVFNDYGFVEESILCAIEEKLCGMTYDLALLLTHYPLLGTDMGNDLRPGAAAHPLSAPGNGYGSFYEFPQINRFREFTEN
jgi:hypothetical protein